ncbi:MAG: hypothetical protein ACRCXT_19750 [Paraclostridium sp.]
MNIKNLQVGQIIKNYKELCDLLGVEPRTGKGRILNHKEFSRYFDYEKQGQKYIITEIHKEVKEKIDNRSNNLGGNNSVFVDDFRNLMIYMLHKNRTESMLMSKGSMFKAMNLVNENYLLARNNIPKLSEIVELPQASIYEFYDYNSGKLRDTLERNLKHCRSRSLLIYESVVAVAIYEVQIAYNELNQPIANSKGQVVYDSKLTYREATKEERQLILHHENEVKKEWGYKDNKDIFVRGKWKQFKQEVEKRLKLANTNIKFYYEAYRITWNNDKIDSEYSLIDTKKCDIETNINNNMVESIKKSTVKRHNKACKESGSETNQYKQNKYFEQEKIEYVMEQEQLTLTLISQNAKSLRDEFEKGINYKKVSTINKEKNNVEQLEMDWDFGDDIEF